MKKEKNIIWLSKPEEHDYPAAESYLLLSFTPSVVKKLVSGLKKAPMAQFKAKDIFRAS